MKKASSLCPLLCVAFWTDYRAGHADTAQVFSASSTYSLRTTNFYKVFFKYSKTNI